MAVTRPNTSIGINIEGNHSDPEMIDRKQVIEALQTKSKYAAEARDAAAKKFRDRWDAVSVAYSDAAFIVHNLAALPAIPLDDRIAKAREFILLNRIHESPHNAPGTDCALCDVLEILSGALPAIPLDREQIVNAAVVPHHDSKEVDLEWRRGGLHLRIMMAEGSYFWADDVTEDEFFGGVIFENPDQLRYAFKRISTRSALPVLETPPPPKFRLGDVVNWKYDGHRDGTNYPITALHQKVEDDDTIRWSYTILRPNGNEAVLNESDFQFQFVTLVSRAPVESEFDEDGTRRPPPMSSLLGESVPAPTEETYDPLTCPCLYCRLLSGREVGLTADELYAKYGYENPESVPVPAPRCPHNRVEMLARLDDETVGNTSGLLWSPICRDCGQDVPAAIDTRAIRAYWESPTGAANAPAGMVELARRHINELCAEIARLESLSQEEE